MRHTREKFHLEVRPVDEGQVQICWSITQVNGLGFECKAHIIDYEFVLLFVIILNA